jgi:hypothetical protein
MDLEQALETPSTRENQCTSTSLSRTGIVEPSSVRVPGETSHVIDQYRPSGTLNTDSWWQDGSVFDLGDSTNTLESTQPWNWLSPKISPIPKTTVHYPRIKDSSIWQRSNVIYGKIFSINPTCGLTASESRVNSLFKAVRKGWESLGIKEQSDPVLEILKEVDKEIFALLDPVTRIAALQKSHMLLTVR